MIEARALVSINFLNLSENYDFMSRWLGVYDKYAKLLKGSSDAVVKDGSGKIPESANDKVDLTNKHLALQAILAEYGQKLNKAIFILKQSVCPKPMIFVANVSAHYR